MMKINHTISTLITADFMVNAGFSLFAPIFAIFVTGQIAGGSIQVVGFAAAITQIVKAVFQLPVARYLDRNHGELDDFFSLTIGNALLTAVPFLFFFATNIVHVYLIQAVLGLGFALVVPPWFAIFTRHIDKNRENVEWSLESIGIGISSAAAAAFGGILATKIGFRYVFLLAGLFAAFGAALQLKIFNDLKKRVPRGEVKPLPDKTVS